MSESTLSQKELLINQFVHDGILDYYGMVNRPTEVKGFKIEDGKDLWLEALLLQYKDLYFDITMEFPISKLELFYLACYKKDLTMLSSFITTNSLIVFYGAIKSNDHAALLERARALFGDDIPSDIIIPSEISKAIDVFVQIKTDRFNKWVALIENKIFSRRQSQAQDNLYQRLRQKLSKEYLLAQIERGDFDDATINTCVRLENLLKNRYHYEGDLCTMINTFIDRQCNSNIDWKRLLHKLRMKRNSLVHVDNNTFVFTIEELKECISILEEIES